MSLHFVFGIDMCKHDFDQKCMCYRAFRLFSVLLIWRIIASVSSMCKCHVLYCWNFQKSKPHMHNNFILFFGEFLNVILLFIIIYINYYN